MINTIDIISKQDLYREELQDPRWKAKRLIILERDHYKCRFCPNTTKLHVHHLAYCSCLKPWEYINELLLTLCETCHTKFHEEHDASWMYRLEEMLCPHVHDPENDPLE